MKTIEEQLIDLLNRLEKLNAGEVMYSRLLREARETIKLIQEGIRDTKRDTKRTAEPVVVAGIKWGAYLTPSENCKEPAHYNEETGMWYFSQPSAIMHAYEQNLRLPTAEEFQQLHDRTTHKWCEQGGKYGTLFTDKETGKSVFFPASGSRGGSNGSFYDVTTNGFGWSSSVSSATNGLYLGFNSSWVYPQYTSNRSTGFPVRCVSSVPHSPCFDGEESM